MRCHNYEGDNHHHIYHDYDHHIDHIDDDYDHDHDNDNAIRLSLIRNDRGWI